MKLIKAKSKNRFVGGEPFITLPRGAKVGEGEEESGISIDWASYDYILSLPSGPAIYAPGATYSQYTAVYSVMNTERTAAFINSIPEVTRKAQIKVLVLGMVDGGVTISEFTTNTRGNTDWISNIGYYAGDNIGINFYSFRSLSGPVTIVNTGEEVDAIVLPIPK